MRNRIVMACCVVTAVVVAGGLPVRAAGPYQATGFKVGEVTDKSAIVWTRLTLRAKRNPADAPMVKFTYASAAKGTGPKPKNRRRKIAGVVYPKGMTVADIRDAVPGVAGEVRLRYKMLDAAEWSETGWRAVDAKRDFTRQFALSDLRAGATYAVRVESRGPGGGAAGQALGGRFRTAPAPDKPAHVVFTASTGQGHGSQDCDDGYAIYAQMLALQPNFFVHTGDIVYYDKLAKTDALARYHWQRTYSLPGNVAFHRRVSSYFIKDDHDTWQNDCWPTDKRENMYKFTFARGLEIFREQVPMSPKTYRTFRWGKDLQIWLVEGRDFRSANTAPDGPDKTIWGAEQKAWFKRTVKASDAAFRILISPTPLVGPDRVNKNDNHANKGFTHEGNELRRFIASQKNMAVICGDRHWQYASVHPQSKVREYGCGAVSDKHAGGWKQGNVVKSHHRYLNVIGGFLSVTVARSGGVPTAIFRHHDVKGKVRNEDQITAEK